MGRTGTGATLATLPLTGAAIAAASDKPGLMWALIGVSGIVLLGTIANRLPVIHHLPPSIGAPRPPTDVRFSLEGHDGLTMRMTSTAREAFILRVTIMPEDRPEEITRVLVNAYVVGATHINRVLPDGSMYRDGGVAGKGPDGPYWSVSGVTLPIGAFEMFFKLTITKPGAYTALLTLRSPEFHHRGDHRYEDVITVLPPEPATDAG
jgi:hypothetical protein